MRRSTREKLELAATIILVLATIFLILFVHPQDAAHHWK